MARKWSGRVQWYAWHAWASPDRTELRTSHVEDYLLDGFDGGSLATEVVWQVATNNHADDRRFDDGSEIIVEIVEPKPEGVPFHRVTIKHTVEVEANALSESEVEALVAELNNPF